MYKSIDLFAGIGGIRLGFDQAFGGEIHTVFVSEWDKKAVETYKANFGDSMDVAGDITKVDESDIPAHDILLAGFPCQAFSLAGYKRGFDDARGTLFFDVARIIKYHKPKLVFCENVKNLVNHDRGRTFKVIREILEDLGYKVFYKVLNSKDFGVPQNRERIYIVAFRNDIAIADFTFPEKVDDTKVINDIVEENEVSPKYYLSSSYLTSLEKHKARHASKGNGFGYEIRSLNTIAGAVVCGGMGRERNLIVDKRLTNFTPVTHIKGEINKNFVRKMTPREWARLQGFPNDFKLVVADTHLYKQFGNSVTVPVIRAIAEEIKKYIKQNVHPKPVKKSKCEQISFFGG
ncbi:DNA cytosine methyltransferase [Pasteurellaceae bacterium HPA106]|uniref:DNA cytosine methyltransferase n=1 Tax=Spirabiliibacterium pneumoniae TaxID=221400 RepID=UPI001AAC9E37|nr:DNA cytosine methyltransferase [Spirabiliibacterium pneumoniae]MBE2895286.1 DNA cytosine methyltransferase [Spirabiliibacterium pneumoniae]